MISLPNILAPQKKHFGLAIGRTSLRGLELNEKGKIIYGGEVIFVEDVFDKTGVVTNKKSFVEALKKLLTAGKFSTQFVAVAFSEVYVFSREQILPKLPFSEIREAISWHVKDLFPLPEAQLYFDWKIISESERNIRVAVVAVPKQVLDPIVETLLASGLKPLSFEPGASAISRVTNISMDKQALVVQVNKKGAYVSLMEGDKALFTTVVNYASATPFENNFMSIVATINEMTAFYKNKGLLKDKIEVILTGELTSKDLMKKFQDAIKLPISILDIGIDKQEYSKAFAVAISSVKPPTDPNTINLLPPEIQTEYDRDYQNAFFTALLIRTLLVFTSLLMLAIGGFISLSVTKDSTDRQVQNLTTVTKAQNKETQNLLQLNAQAKNIIRLAPLRKTPKDKILAIQSILPAGVVINQWEYDDNKQQFNLSGVALERNHLLLFKQKLEETEEFSKVNLPLEYLALPQNIEFTISFLNKR